MKDSKNTYKSTKDYIKKYSCFTVIFIILTATVLISSACCIGLNSFLEPKEVIVTFSDNPEIAGQEDVFNANENEDNIKIDYSDIKKELADMHNYEISLTEEEELFSELEKIYDKEKFILVKEYLKDFKYLYPQGYFTIIQVTRRQNYSAGYGWFELMNNKSTYSIEELESYLEGFDDFDITIKTPDFYEGYSNDIIVIVHELTHCGSGPFINLFVKDVDCHFYQDYSFMVGNYLILIERDKVFFSKYEIFQDIESPDLFDKTYLDRGQQSDDKEDIKLGDVDFTNILDELNAYTVSAKCAVATEQYRDKNSSSSERYGLLKQMCHLELYLKRCYEKHPEDWESLVSHKGFAFLIMKLWQEAEKMEAVIKDDPRFNRGSEAVSEFVYESANYKIIKMLFEESGVIEYKNNGFKDSSIEFDGLTVYDINDL